LPSARQTALGKDPFANGKFPEGSLPRAALGKAFAEGLIAFAEGLRPSTKILSAVVCDERCYFFWLCEQPKIKTDIRVS